MIYSDPDDHLKTAPKPDERAIKAQIEQLRQTWKAFSFPVQELLEEHLQRYGLEAAVDATRIARRVQ